jgi:predicted CXXCH cytochrome family protein
MMKTSAAVALSGIIAFAAVGGLAWGGIEGSKHDFSKKPWAAGETCGACHTPHRDQLPKAAPLWDPAADLTRTFGRMTTRAVSTNPPTADERLGEQSVRTNARERLGEHSAFPGSGTLMCLRCHDGTVAKETIAGVLRARFVNKQNPGLFGAVHGGTDHPVGIEYPLFKKGYRPVTSVVAKGTVVLPQGRVECISCHDPHNTAGAAHMLVTANTRSALCLTCHKK